MKQAHWDVQTPNGCEDNIVARGEDSGAKHKCSKLERAVLTFDPISFFSEKEKQAFFVWLKRIPSVAYSVEDNGSVHVTFKDEMPSQDDLLELAALFYRYKIDIKKLNKFLDDIKKDWQLRKDGKPNHRNAWPNQDGKPSFGQEGSELVCKKIWYYSLIDEDIFFEWLGQIPSAGEIKGILDQLFVNIKGDTITDEDLKELLALFYRYDVDMNQLKVFLNDKNKKWFFDDKNAYWNERVFGSDS